MAKMSTAQRDAILAAHSTRTNGSGSMGMVSAHPLTMRALRTHGYVSGAFDIPTTAGLVAAGVDMGKLWNKALTEWTVRDDDPRDYAVRAEAVRYNLRGGRGDARLWAAGVIRNAAHAEAEREYRTAPATIRAERGEYVASYDGSADSIRVVTNLEAFTDDGYTIGWIIPAGVAVDADLESEAIAHIQIPAREGEGEWMSGLSIALADEGYEPTGSGQHFGNLFVVPASAVEWGQPDGMLGATEAEEAHHTTSQRNALGTFIGCTGPACAAAEAAIEADQRGHRIMGVDAGAAANTPAEARTGISDRAAAALVDVAELRRTILFDEPFYGPKFQERLNRIEAALRGGQ
jgi:hypothetical protein